MTVKLTPLKPTQWLCKMSFRTCPSPGEAEPEGAGCRSAVPAGAGPAERSRSGALRPREGAQQIGLGSARQDAPRLALLSKQGSLAEPCSTPHLPAPATGSLRAEASDFSDTFLSYSIERDPRKKIEASIVPKRTCG